MIPKFFKILRNGKSQIPGIYIRYSRFCGTSRPVYIGQTDNIFGSRPTRAVGTYEEIRLLESVSNKRRREEYEASLIIKLEPLEQRVYKNLPMYKKYFSLAKNANLLNKKTKFDCLKKIIDFSVYNKTLKTLNDLKEKVHKINNLQNEYFNSFCSNKKFREWKRSGIYHSDRIRPFGIMIKDAKLASGLLFIDFFTKELDELEKYMFKKQRNLNKFKKYNKAIRQLLRITSKKNHPGEYGKYVEIDPFVCFAEIKQIFMKSFFFEYANDFKCFLEKQLEQLPPEKKVYFNVKYEIAFKYCLNNKDEMISKIITNKESFIKNEQY